MNWGLIGCGVIGERRIVALPEGVKLTACFDPNQERAQVISRLTGAKICSSAEELMSQDLTAVIVAPINAAMVPTMNACLARGLHVLAEKPAARSYQELASLNVGAGAPKVKIGFNHRFHPAFEELCREIKSRPDDPIMFIRAQYGNGARLGFDKEWRSNVELAGGGELLDQGVHLLDLASVLVPGLEVVSGYCRTHYWDMPVDDNTWAILRGQNGATFSFHVSSSEWKNEFRFEVYTRQRKYQWLGLGRSYGPERLIIYQMKPEMGPPEMIERQFPGEDDSWKNENRNFLKGVLGEGPLNGDHTDALRCLKLVDGIYEKSLAVTADKTTHPQWYKGK